MALRIVVLIGILLSFTSFGGGSASAVSHQTSLHSIALGPSQVTAGPGEMVTYTVTVHSLQDAFSGTVLVIVPNGLTVSGHAFLQQWL